MDSRDSRWRGKVEAACSTTQSPSCRLFKSKVLELRHEAVPTSMLEVQRTFLSTFSARTILVV